MRDNEREFNDLLTAEVVRRGGAEDEYWAQDDVMRDLAWSSVTLDGKPTETVMSKGGPDSDRNYWIIVVNYDGNTYMCNADYDSYEFSEMGVFYEAEAYVEPVTKYRRKK